jgi:hypothetical protein
MVALSFPIKISGNRNQNLVCGILMDLAAPLSLFLLQVCTVYPMFILPKNLESIFKLANFKPFTFSSSRMIDSWKLAYVSFYYASRVQMNMWIEVLGWKLITLGAVHTYTPQDLTP